MDLIKNGTYTLFPGSCDINGDVKLFRLAEIFSQLADEQVDDLKQEYPFLSDDDHRWILVRYRISIDRMMKSEETFMISTYQSYYSKYLCVRDYIVKDECGETLITAQCDWILRSSTSGKISAIPEAYKDLTYRPNQNKLRKAGKIQDLDHNLMRSFPIQTRYTDYDYNQHVNNAVYFSYIVNNQVPIDPNKYKLKNVDISYKFGMLFENKYQMCYEFKRESNILMLYQKIYNEEHTAAIIKTEWEEKKSISEGKRSC